MIVYQTSHFVCILFTNSQTNKMVSILISGYDVYDIMMLYLDWFLFILYKNMEG